MLVTLQLKGQSKKYSINVTWGRRKNKRLKLNLGWLDMNRIFYGRRIGQKKTCWNGKKRELGYAKTFTVSYGVTLQLYQLYSVEELVTAGFFPCVVVYRMNGQIRSALH